MQLFKQSTAATISVGPCLDSAGAEYTGLVIGDLTLGKNGTEAAMASAATLTATSNGHYDLVMTTGNTDTLGRFKIRCNKSTYQMPVVEGMVVPAMIYDSAVLGTDVLQADVTQILGEGQSATDAKDFFDEGYDPATNKVAGVVLVDTTTANSDMRGTDSAALATELAKVPKSDGTVAFNSTAVGAIAAAMESAILDEGDATALLAAIAAKVEEFLINEGDATATIAAIATACNAAVAAGAVGSNVTAIKAKTDNLPSAPASTGDVTSARDSVLTVLGTPADTDLATDIAAVKTDTGNLVTRITSTLFSGITSLAQWLGALAGKQAPNSTALAEINATGAGSGTYDPATDSLEAPVSVALGPDDIQDIVDGVSQGLSFPTAEDIASELAGNNVVATFPLLIEGEETVIIQGEDYFDADGNAATVTITATGIEAAVADDWDFVFWGQGDSTGQVVAGSPSSGGANSITVKFDLPAAKTSLVTAGLGGWRVVHKPYGTTREFSEVEGLLRVKPTK